MNGVTLPSILSNPYNRMNLMNNYNGGPYDNSYEEQRYLPSSDPYQYKTPQQNQQQVSLFHIP